MRFLLSPNELRSLLGDPRLVLFDIRSRAGRGAYEAGHIPGARFVSLKEDVTGVRTGKNGRNPMPEPSVFAEKMRGFGVSGETLVVVYDEDRPAFAARLWFELRAAGFAGVRVLDGGYAAWEKAGFAVTREEPSPAVPGDFTPREALERVVTVEEVEKNLPEQKFLLVDSRPADRFHGIGEKEDPVAGHIPGSFSCPASAGYGPDGRILPREALQKAFAQVERTAAGRPVVNSCGSGIAASATQLAMREAGLSPAGVYVGSWSEWSSDPRRPVERG